MTRRELFKAALGFATASQVPRPFNPSPVNGWWMRAGPVAGEWTHYILREGGSLEQVYPLDYNTWFTNVDPLAV